MNRDAFFDDGPPIAQLQAAVKSLEEFVHQAVPSPAPPRTPPDEPSSTSSTAAGDVGRRRTSTVVDTRRLTAVERFGQQEVVAAQWRALRRQHVAIYGLGAVGARVAETLVRSRVGKVLLVDHAVVAAEAMGEMAYEAEEVGFSRTQALRLRLQSLGADQDGDGRPRVETFQADVTHASDRLALQKKLKMSAVGHADAAVSGADGGGGAQGGAPATRGRNLGLFEALTLKRPYDVVLCCSNDAAAKRVLNTLCLELSLPLLDVEISPTNAAIALHTVLPGATCCLECIRDVRRESPMDQVVQSLAGAFPAVLPHVELTAAGYLSQQAIKYVHYMTRCELHGWLTDCVCVCMVPAGFCSTLATSCRASAWTYSISTSSRSRLPRIQAAQARCASSGSRRSARDSRVRRARCRHRLQIHLAT